MLADDDQPIPYPNEYLAVLYCKIHVHIAENFGEGFSLAICEAVVVYTHTFIQNDKFRQYHLGDILLKFPAIL